MTTNQIRFAELRESKRHNVETERQGVQKLTQDYDVGVRQAKAAATSAAAAQTNAGANMINAATRQAELDWAKYQYDDTGSNKVKSETGLNEARAEQASAQAGVAEEQGRLYRSQANVAQSTELPQILTIGAKAVGAQLEPGLNFMKGVTTMSQLGQ